MSRRNIVGHCYRPDVNNDKVYMCCIRNTGLNQWTVLAKWGRRGKKKNVQDKATYSTEAAAVVYQESLWKDRLKEGYLDIESAEYQQYMNKSGSGIRVALDSEGIKEHLEQDDAAGLSGAANVNGVPVIEWQCDRCGKKYAPDLNASGLPVPGTHDPFCPDCLEKIREAAKRAARRMNGDGDDVMVCVDNSGMEDRFDIGIEYLVEDHTDPATIHVYDKLGRKDEYFRIRFMVPEQWAKKQGKITVNIVKSRETVPGDQKIELKKFEKGDVVRIVVLKGRVLKNVELSEDQIKLLLEHRGGCTCSTGHPPCSACSSPLTQDEFDELGFGRSSTLPTRQKGVVV